MPHLGIPNPSTHVFIQKTTEIISDLQRFLCLGGGAKSQPERCPRLPTQNGSPQVGGVVLREKLGWKRWYPKKTRQFLEVVEGGDTVDGRNPAPPGMYETLQIMG